MFAEKPYLISRKWLSILLVARCLYLDRTTRLVRSNERNPLFLLPLLRPWPKFNGTIVHRLTTSLKLGVEKKAFQSNFSWIQPIRFNFFFFASEKKYTFSVKWHSCVPHNFSVTAKKKIFQITIIQIWFMRFCWATESGSVPYKS